MHDKRISEVSEREAAFFDRAWQDTKLRRIHGKLRIPEVNDLKGLKVLICSCGSGQEPVLAANAGADVFAFDISSTAVEKAVSVAQYNNVRIEATVMDFHALLYPSSFFDVVYGGSILHHVDCDKAGREVYRVLKDNGIAFFQENSDRNWILRFFRRAMFGSPGGIQRKRFLFFARHGTSDEYPLTEEEVRVLARIFGGHMRRVYTDFVFFRLLEEFGWRNRRLRDLLTGFDRFIARLFPFVMPYGFTQGIWLQKRV